MTHILGFGGYVPERVMTNDEWAALVDTSDEWITQRTGIKRRRVAAPDESTLTLAGQAAGVAIKDAGFTADDIDEIIVATDTPEVYTPDTAALLQDLLGCRNIPTYDLGGSGCAGFVQGLDVARARIAFSPKTILVVGVELITRLIDWNDRSTAVLFGDAAGAVVLGRNQGGPPCSTWCPAPTDLLPGSSPWGWAEPDIPSIRTPSIRAPTTASSWMGGGCSPRRWPG
jgi:3-oxoacyl-[acyl-carrier-protein] synthase-3